ncbi:MAG TPA: FAD-linked oxidase C-terminal domain-containing protein, partial [Propionibacteriaceae bacterium]|nr:FAD-linked oxidase C-terminal domain-containing protein [Propionibacteriaceae bacterium]
AGAKEVFVTTDPEEGELFVAARRATFPAIEARGAILLEDVGVPVPQLPELLAGIAAVADRYSVEIPVVAHAGDGNTHPIVIYDRGDEAARDRAYRAFAEIMQLAIGLGGTITGEHGVGRAKKAALPTQLGPEVMTLSLTIKNALDPLGILNPGAIF